MRTARHFTTLPILALAAFAHADNRVVLGKLGQATEPTAVYSSPSNHARMFYRVKSYGYMIVKNSGNPDWDMVLLKNRHYGYVPSYTVAVLPYTMYLKPGKAGGLRDYNTSSRSGSAMADYALNFQGTPYEWGGNDLVNGIDCSGFVKKMAGSIGMDLPRTAAEQAGVGQPIYRLEDLRAGDRLYFYEKKRGKIGHTGIYLGNGHFIHASHGKGGVVTDTLSANWRKILVAARR